MRVTTIAITVNTAWNIVNFRSGLVRGLLGCGYRVLAIAPPDDQAQTLRDMGAKFIPLQRLARKGKNPVEEFLLIRELRSIYTRESVAVALQYTIKPVIYGTIAAQGTSTQVINTITGLGYAFLSKGIVHRVVKRLYRYSLAHSNRLYFQNHDDRELFLRRSMVQPGAADIMPGSGINIDYFRPVPQTAPTKPEQFLFVGRLLTDKGVRELFEAATLVKQEYPEVQFHVVGQIDNLNPAAIRQAELQQYIDAGTVVYHGPISDIRSFIAQATAVVLPSYREGLPRVMLEGMAMAKPLITTDVPGCRDTVFPGENGFLVPVKDSVALADAIKRMIQTPEAERRNMGARGRKLAEERFSESMIVSRYLNEIEELTLSEHGQTLLAKTNSALLP